MDDYEPRFDRVGTTRRVLGHVTDEDHAGRGPRNTLDRLVVELAEDPHTDIGPDAPDDVRHHLDLLVDAGLLVQRPDNTYEVTDDGMYELTH